MSLSTDYSGNRKSVFVCDRCETKILGDERVTIRAYRPKQQTIIKKWDLCPVCYRKLYKGIEKYKKTE